MSRIVTEKQMLSFGVILLAIPGVLFILGALTRGEWFLGLPRVRSSYDAWGRWATLGWCVQGIFFIAMSILLYLKGDLPR